MQEKKQIGKTNQFNAGSLQKQGEEKVKRYKQRNFEYHITHR